LKPIVMRHMIIALLSFLPVINLRSQKPVTNHAPLVTVDFYKTLFIGIDNPISFSTGKYDNAVMVIDNGTITHNDSSGRYFIKPEKVGDAILKMKTKDKSYEFVFRVRPLPYPTLDLAGPRNMDGMPVFKQSDSVVAFIRHFYYDVRYRVDSFAISFSGKGFDQPVSHINIGGAWDSETRKLIDRCQDGTLILISQAYVTGPFWEQIKLRDQMPFLVH
jgi:hypothetical protein